MVPVDEGGERQTGENSGMPLLRWSGAFRLKLPGKRASPLVERAALVGAFQIESSTHSRTCLPVNEITIKNRYPLPLMTTAFDYRLVCIREGDEWETAFNTLTGHWEYIVMPFRLTNAPAVNNILMINRFVIVYLDDMFIFSKDPKEHTTYVCKVLQRLLENRLFIKAEKCEFSCSFLGYFISAGSISITCIT